MRTLSEQERMELVQQGVRAVEEEEYLLGFVLLIEAYAGMRQDARVADGLSHYGLCMALVEKKFKPAIDMCRKAIELQFYNASHYLNLAKVYVAAGASKKAVETLDEGLRVIADDRDLKRMRSTFGYRSRPAVSFLDRSNPINKAIGMSRSRRKDEDES